MKEEKTLDEILDRLLKLRLYEEKIKEERAELLKEAEPLICEFSVGDIVTKEQRFGKAIYVTVARIERIIVTWDFEEKKGDYGFFTDYEARLFKKNGEESRLLRFIQPAQGWKKQGY